MTLRMAQTPLQVEEKIAATVGTEQITNAELEEKLNGQYRESMLRTLMVVRRSDLKFTNTICMYLPMSLVKN